MLKSTEESRSSAALYSKLSPGPGMSASEVASHQRARIHGAMVEIASKRGYDAVRVRELAQLAGVSTRTFYEHFANKEECFLSTHELVVRRTAQRVFASQKDGRDWAERVRLAFRALSQEFAARPEAARLALVEPFAAGPAALERMRRTGALFEAMAREGLSSAPDGLPTPPLVVKGITAGIGRVACARLLDGRERELPLVADELMGWALCFRSEATSNLGPLEGRAAQSAARFSEDKRDTAIRNAFGGERELILAATTRLAAKEGYQRLSVPGIRAAAGVSRKGLDAHFEDVTDCFLAALEQLIRQEIARAVRWSATADTWPGGVHRSLVAFCTAIARDPALARLGFIEVFAPGTPGIRFRARLITAVAERFRRSAPPQHCPSELAAEASVGAALGIIHHRIARGRADQLPRVAPTLAFLLLAPAIGAPAAVSAIRADLDKRAGRDGDAERMAADHT